MQLSVAVRKKNKKDGQPDADFIRVTAWRALGDTCAKYLRKGRKVYVRGVPSVSAWTGQDGLVKVRQELTADEVEFLQAAGETGGSAQAEAGALHEDPESGRTVVEDQELPF